MGFHRKYLFKCDWCGKEILAEVDDKRSIDYHAYIQGYALINIERAINSGEIMESEYYACPSCINKIMEGLNDGET